ncbi:hypothetical protein BCR35DRAFT_39586 [Leucosporidium creatinivorum]|uniref:Uncharacterized protein n=1 Tax=Leucosporidium creatinivorum TaxID=106004 RepID=A0A1Y2FTZ7_9BASI|nr:hypothetical protein BCR35DRAFT_39586 [Leucosporidium creatinivorum]
MLPERGRGDAASFDALSGMSYGCLVSLGLGRGARPRAPILALSAMASCSRSCQVTDWPKNHSEVCQFLQQQAERTELLSTSNPSLCVLREQELGVYMHDITNENVYPCRPFGSRSLQARAAQPHSRPLARPLVRSFPCHHARAIHSQIGDGHPFPIPPVRSKGPAYGGERQV